MYFTNKHFGCIISVLFPPGNVSNGKDCSMEPNLLAQLEKLLNVYSHQYDIERDVTVEDRLSVQP